MTELKLNPLSSYILRTPAFPFSTLHDFSINSLKEIYQDPYMKEAIFLASPVLYKELQNWLSEPNVGQEELSKKDQKRQKKLIISLTKYFLRACYRCTPFGLFAGVSWGEIADETTNLQEFKIVALEEVQRHLRLDMDYLCGLILHLSQIPTLRNELSFFPNNTLYQTGNHYRYVGYQIKNKFRSYKLESVDYSPYLQRLLQKAQSGATIQVLAEELTDQDISLEEATEFINEVIDSQILTSELEPFITGRSYLKYVANILKQKTSVNNIGEVLDTIIPSLQDTQGGIQLYQQIFQKLKKLPHPVDITNLFQVDISKPSYYNKFPIQVTHELEKVIKLLSSVRSYKDESSLHKFRELFQKKYEEQEVPLLEALDPEIGIGYPPKYASTPYTGDLLNEIVIPSGGSTNPSYEWNEWSSFLLSKYIKTMKDEKNTLTITENEIQSFLNKPRTNSNSIANSLFTLGSVLATETEDIHKDDFQIIHEITGGPSMANLLGRFCSMNQDFQQFVKDSLAREEAQQPDAIFAEIIHINQAKTGNIAIRPILRKYEIPIVTQPGVHTEQVISLEDLMLSVSQDSIILRSKKFNKEVIPRLSNAHNYGFRALPFYHFLCDLQYQNTLPNLEWSWGILQHISYLPRVVYSKTILAKARWIITSTELQKAVKAGINGIQKLLNDRHIPQKFILKEEENELLLDKNNPLCLQVFQNTIKPNKNFIIEECIFNEQNLVVQDTNGQKYTNEFIIAWEKTIPQKIHHRPNINDAFVKDTPQICRNFALGSEWLYIKIYCGLNTTNILLTDIIKPLTEQCLENKIIDKWFFIRYADPHPHIRLRFHGSGQFYSEVIHLFNQMLTPYLQTGMVHNFTTDTYKRELERYGDENIIESETLFFHDSVNTLNVLSLETEDKRLHWILALKGIDHLLDNFRLSIHTRKQLLTQMDNSFKEEFKMTSKNQKKSLSNKYRKERQYIEQVLSSKETDSIILSKAYGFFIEHGTQVKTTIDQLLLKHKNGTLKVNLGDLISSHIHMFLNRFFYSHQRSQEMVLYDFMLQYYTSILAKERKNHVNV